MDISYDFHFSCGLAIKDQMGLLSFIFGKKPKINFSSDGRVSHDHPEKKWEDWKNRFRQNPNYNWRSHSGTKGTPQLKSKTTNK